MNGNKAKIDSQLIVNRIEVNRAYCLELFKSINRKGINANAIDDLLINALLDGLLLLIDSIIIKWHIILILNKRYKYKIERINNRSCIISK